MTREEVAAAVCSALAEAGIEVVLSGDAVVSIYSENAYESDDLDLIRTGLGGNVARVVRKLGFSREERYWRHDKTRYWVEFPPGPVSVGEAFITEFAELETSAGVLSLLTPTHCVMDRLAGYYHWNDPQALDQALAVASRQPVDLEAIGDWSRRERATEKFQQFCRGLELLRRA